jgi:hypothetical protein
VRRKAHNSDWGRTSGSIKVLAPILLCICAPSFADELGEPHWTAVCKSTPTISLSFDSDSGDVEADDMTATVRFPQKKMGIEIQPKLYRPMPLNGLKSICDKLPAIAIGKKYLLVLFGADERPNLDRIGAVLINLESQEVADTSMAVGSYVNLHHDLRFRIIPSGLRMKMAQGWLKHGDSDGPENLLLGWKTILVSDGKISSRWEKPLPPTYIEY